MESHLRVEITPGADEQPPTVRIGSAEFRVVDYAVQTDGGIPVLSLVVAPDSLSIGEAPAVSSPPAAGPQISSWSSKGKPDPRESIPGWQPESLGEQVAGHAERVALRTWEPNRSQDQSSAFKRLVRFGCDASSVAVTA